MLFYQPPAIPPGDIHSADCHCSGCTDAPSGALAIVLAAIIAFAVLGFFWALWVMLP